MERMDGRSGAARHVGPPRTLDVQQFAAARSSEIQVLYNALKTQATNSGAGQLALTTPRHLRRRTASHNRRVPFRWMQNATQRRKKDGSVDGSVRPSIVSSCPGQCNVTPESEEKSSQKRKTEKRRPSRRVRRRTEFLGLRDGNASCMRDGTRRLATHVWHAKRFPMTKAWGYCLPEGLPGRGRGSRAVYKWVKDAAVLHDASYIGIIELQGSADAILQTLSQALEPPPLSSVSGCGVKEEEMQGLLYGNAVLHSIGKSSREAIAPVTMLWRPLSAENKETPALSKTGERAVEERQLWIWVHPSAFDSALLAVSTACQKQCKDNPQAIVRCRSRRGELAQLDLFGSRALQVLQKVLRPVRRLTYLRTEVTKHAGNEDGIAGVTTPTSSEGSQPLSARIFANADHLPAAAVLALDVYDPRDTSPAFSPVHEAKFLQADQDGAIHGNLPGDIRSTSIQSMDEDNLGEDIEPFIHSTEPDVGSIQWGNFIEKGLIKDVSDSPYLWSPQADQKVAALTQKEFSEKRHIMRKAYFSGIDSDSLHNKLETGAMDRMLAHSEACPVLLLKRAHSRPSASGWSIIMPITWVHAFWVPIIFSGGHVIGLRERHWLATDAGIPYFPHDFPDCRAHAQHLVAEAAALDSANEARPPSKRAPYFTVSPLQTSVMISYGKCIPDGCRRTSSMVSEIMMKEDCKQEERCTYSVDIPKLTDMDGNSAMTDVVIDISRAPYPPLSSLSADCWNVPEPTNPDGDTRTIGTGSVFTRSSLTPVACQIFGASVSQGTTPCGKNAENYIDSLVDKVSSLPVASETADGKAVTGLRVSGGDTSTTGTDNPSMAETDIKVAGPPFPEVALTIGDRLSVQQFVEPIGDIAAIAVDPLGDWVKSSQLLQSNPDAHDGVQYDSQRHRSVAQDCVTEKISITELHAWNSEVLEKVDDLTNSSDLYQPPVPLLVPVPSCVTDAERLTLVPEACDSDQFYPRRCSSGAQILPDEEASITEPRNCQNSGLLEVADNLTRSHGLFPEPVHVPSSDGDGPLLVPNSIITSTTDAERFTVPFFVARTMDALMQALREKDLHHALILGPCFMNNGGVQSGLRQGRLEWRASHAPVESTLCKSNNKIHAMVGGQLKSCYVRVLIVVPRRGVLKENGLLCSPTKEDYKVFLGRSQHWQGVETSWQNIQAKELKKEKGKGKKRGATAKPLRSQPRFEKGTAQLGHQECCNREAIGCITSTGPQGSSWSGMGICEVGSLMKLRAMQWADQRWWNEREILLLAGSKLCPILRPVLVSIVLETGNKQDILW